MSDRRFRLFDATFGRTQELLAFRTRDARTVTSTPNSSHGVPPPSVILPWEITRTTIIMTDTSSRQSPPLGPVSRHALRFGVGAASQVVSQAH